VDGELNQITLQKFRNKYNDKLEDFIFVFRDDEKTKLNSE